MVQLMNKRIFALLSAFVLAGILALCLTATAVLAASNGALAVADDGGADDVSGNLDLNYLSYDTSQQANQGLIGATWTWDVTALPPGENATGCAAFDSSGDGKANKMLCATLAISPTPNITSTIVYACDSSNPVICGAAAAQAPAGCDHLCCHHNQ